MQVELSFIFPHVLRELPVGFLLPYPLQRSRTVANLAFMCTGQLPLPEELLHALHIADKDVAYESVEEARAAGLAPFSDSAVIRIDRAAAVEIGSSTTKSIFGSFVSDEPLTLPPDVLARGQSIAGTMFSLKAGTLLYGNLGFPNSQASRYYVLLEPLITPEQRAEFAGFAPLGMVTSGLEELRRACAQTAVQPRTLVPKKKVVVSASRMQLDYAQLSAAAASLSTTAILHPPTSAEGRKAEMRERLAGRVRRRDEDDEEGEADPRSAAENDGAAGGFFQMSARFPKAVAMAVVAATGGGVGSAMKRRRAEATVTGHNGEVTLRTTAIAPGEQAEEGSATLSGFDFYKAQQDAFMNDIDAIQDTQRERHSRSVHKNKKRQGYVNGGHRAGHRKQLTGGKRKGSTGATHTAVASTAQRRQKKVTKRY